MIYDPKTIIDTKIEIQTESGDIKESFIALEKIMTIQTKTMFFPLKDIMDDEEFKEMRAIIIGNPNDRWTDFYRDRHEGILLYCFTCFSKGIFATN